LDTEDTERKLKNQKRKNKKRKIGNKNWNFGKFVIDSQGGMLVFGVQMGFRGSVCMVWVR
jgi:glutathione peroxidase-family protein